MYFLPDSIFVFPALEQGVPLRPALVALGIEKINRKVRTRVDSEAILFLSFLGFTSIV